MKKYFINILFLVLLVGSFHMDLSAQNYSLTLIVEGVQQVKGKMQVGLFNRDDDFLETGSEYKVAAVPVDSTSIIVSFNNLPIGKYAISLYHDLDSSGEINKNFIGIPLEPYGISNDAWHRLSAPKWEEASFTMDTDKTIVIHLRH